MRSPGLVDLQVNGFAGIDFNSGTITAEGLDHALDALLATGVTSCLPTLITAHPEELEARFAALDLAVRESRLGPTMCPGYHLEGPFLNPADGYAGCHPAAAMRAADPDLVERLAAGLSRPILMVTTAPEIEGGLTFVEAMRKAGRLVAIGHSAAGFDDVRAAVAAGATVSTHLGNGLPQSLHKLNNPLFAQLSEDGLAATFIADGIHIRPEPLKALVRAKGVARSVLVTDAVAAAAAPPGLSPFAGMTVERGTDGSVRVPGGASLAGSSLCLDAAVRNIVAWGIASPEEALAMAGDHPARLLAPALAAGRVRLSTGQVEWSDDLAVRRVRVGRIERRVAGPVEA